ncbi:MAG: SgcJ/EcaC family oxidoreductase [Bacteroidota bacterium]
MPAPSLETLNQTIRTLNRKMEKAYLERDLQAVADFYTNDAYLLGPQGERRQGRAAIDQRWARIKQPVRWQLDIIKISNTANDLYTCEFWQNLTNKPPHWNGLTLPPTTTQPHLYQLGHAQLEYEREDATHQVDHFDFIFIWQKQLDGTYRIVLETYANNPAH